MTTLLENPLPILAVGAVLGTLFGLIFLSRRNLPSLVGLGTVVLFTALFLITEQLIVTPREEVEVSLAEILDGVQANDTSSVLALVDPAATEVRSHIETLMPMVKVEDTGATAIQIDCEGKAPTTATSRFKGRLRGVHGRSGVAVFYFDQVEVDWVRRDGRWLLEGFTVFRDGKPLDALKSLKGNRPTPLI